MVTDPPNWSVDYAGISSHYKWSRQYQGQSDYCWLLSQLSPPPSIWLIILTTI